MNLRKALEGVAQLTRPQDEVFSKGLGVLLSNAADTAEAIAIKILMENKNENTGETKP